MQRSSLLRRVLPRRLVALPLVALVVLPLAASAQRRDTTAPRDTSPPQPAGAPVVFEGDTLFWLYGSLGPFTAAERAAAIRRQLQRIVRAGVTKTDSITIADAGASTELLYRDAVIMTVLDADARGVGRSRAELAGTYAARLQQAITHAGEQRSLRTLVIHLALALLATLVLALLLRGATAVFPRLYRRIDALGRTNRLAVRIQRFELVSGARVAHGFRVAAQLARVVLTVVLFYVWLSFTLDLFPWTAPFAGRLVSYTLTPIATALGAFASYLPNLFYIALIVLITRYVLKFMHFVFRAIETGGITISGFFPDWAEPTYKIFRVLVLAFALVVLFPYLPGASTKAFQGISIFLGVLLSLGSTSAVANVVAGVVLTYTRAFQMGDRVLIGDVVGDVTERTLLVTRVHTVKNEEVTIPNGNVLSGHVTNYSALARTGRLLLHTEVTIGYDAPWRTVHQLLLDAARATPHLLADPAPFVLQTSLDDFFVTYQLNAATDDASRMPLTYSLLHQSIQDAFNAAGVEIMSPHYAAWRDGNRSTIPGSTEHAAKGGSGTPPSPTPPLTPDS